MPIEVEKISPETPSDSRLGNDSELSVTRDADKENEGQRPTTNGDETGEPATAEDGGPVERTESQATKLGKKKAVIIILAISV